ncbi:MAG: GDP-mannose 4,6-dehydratase [Croceibacterium sp.]
MSRRILVTGAAGFIGAAVTEGLLARGDHVVGIDNCNAYYSVALKEDRIARVQAAGGSRFDFRNVDFSHADSLGAALADVDFTDIVHLGAQPGVRYSLENPHAYAQSNLIGHLNVLELVRSRETQHLVYASSSSVYGGNAKVPFSIGDRVDHPYSLYAATKKADELMSETYAHLYRLRQTGLRFFTVYGPWGRPDMMPWIFAAKIMRGDPIPVFNDGKMERDFTYIDDIVAGVIAALDRVPSDDGDEKPGGSHAPHAIYNLGNSRPEPLLKVIGIIEKACGRNAVLDMQPMQPGDVPRTFADISETERDLGWRPTTAVEDGFPRFVRWFKVYHALA